MENKPKHIVRKFSDQTLRTCPNRKDQFTMKNSLIPMNATTMTPLAFVALLISGCHHTDRPEPEDATRAVKKAGYAIVDAADAVEKNTKQAANAVENKLDKAGEEIKESRQEFVAATKAKAQEIDREFEQLDAQLEKKGRKLSAKAKRARQNAAKKLDELEHTTEAAWQNMEDNMRSGTRKMLAELESELREARRELAADQD